jgi:hypothetical protein
VWSKSVGYKELQAIVNITKIAYIKIKWNRIERETRVFILKNSGSEAGRRRRAVDRFVDKIGHVVVGVLRHLVLRRAVVEQRRCHAIVPIGYVLDLERWCSAVYGCCCCCCCCCCLARELCEESAVVLTFRDFRGRVA